MFDLDRIARFAPLVLLLASACALGSAYTAQYAFGLEPCILCLYQRIPYALAGALAMGALFLPAASRGRAVVVGLCGVVFLAEAGLAFYHVGVEQHWWVAVTACSGEIKQGLSLDELKAALMATPPKRCDEITWTVLGQSITVWNTVIALGLAVACLTAGHLMYHRRRG